MSLKIQDGLHHKSAYKSCRTSLSEIFFSLLGCHQKFLLDNLRGRRPFSNEGEFEVEDDFIDNFVVFDEAYDTHLTYVSAKKEGTIYFTSMATTKKTLLLFCIFYLCGQMIPCKWISCFGKGTTARSNNP